MRVSVRISIPEIGCRIRRYRRRRRREMRPVVKYVGGLSGLVVDRNVVIGPPSSRRGE